jgi:hypothetical protein
MRGGGGMRPGGGRGFVAPRAGHFGARPVFTGGFRGYRPFVSGFSRPFYSGFAYPVVYGGFGYSAPYYPNYYGGYYAPAPYTPPVTVISDYAPPTPVIISIPPTQPAPQREMEPRTEAEPLFLIAMRDDSIQIAVAYWIDGGTLHYVTRQKKTQQVALDRIDLELTIQLNRERGVSINLPR